MRLNDLHSPSGARTKRKRVGRGPGSGVGKRCGRGDKGQHSRAGGYHKVGFEGGQMPLQRRLPKRGFRSMSAGECAEVRLHELQGLDAEVVDLMALKKGRVIPGTAKRAKVIASGVLAKPVSLKGIAVTKGAREQIEAAGGTIEN